MTSPAVLRHFCEPGVTRYAVPSLVPCGGMASTSYFAPFSETATRPDGVNSTTRTRPLLRISSFMLQLVYVSMIFTRYRCRAYLRDTGALANQTWNKQTHSLSMAPCTDWRLYARRIASPRMTIPQFSHNLNIHSCCLSLQTTQLRQDSLQPAIFSYTIQR
ncbi:hypothetical protein CY34DRAFT_447245 [Suillus luteus UH-Slu-Lm8-n1]|uniref:Uncharacterized protein n=1 Tax=Suillus luteus UH-Slu-Lm8-n1 TaxID=930992 RepID=A0A0D0A7L5_9AGAM|nr:hypothetical protein CY34DRAFT_447245 [Suillus luteus UH-Slu-Lm8-n1]